MNCNLPKDFHEALKLLALLARRMREAGTGEPVVIGASAIEIHSNGAYPCGDIEITVQDTTLCQEQLIRIGFHPDDPNSIKRRYWNEDLCIGIRISARVPFGGRALSAHQVAFETGCGPVRIISLEDTIAALIGAFDVNPRQHQAQLEQATHLYKTAGALNRNYLDLRLRHETMGGRSLAWFVSMAAQRTAVARWG